MCCSYRVSVIPPLNELSRRLPESKTHRITHLQSCLQFQTKDFTYYQIINTTILPLCTHQVSKQGPCALVASPQSPISQSPTMKHVHVDENHVYKWGKKKLNFHHHSQKTALLRCLINTGTGLERQNFDFRTCSPVKRVEGVRCSKGVIQ